LIRVVNASPLIVLSHLGRLDLLREPRPGIEVAAPQAVLDEVMRGELDDPAVALVPVAVDDWLRVIPTPPVHPSIQPRRLDPGEIAVLSVALDHPGWEAVLDDHAARREAARLGVPGIGTVGLVLTGRRLGIVPSVRDALQSLRDAGMYISDGLFRLALDEAGE
jgi:predicted nucleic acid-binding protein